MAFAFMDISKIKSYGQLTSKYNHNCRKIQIDNVIPELSDKNETLVELPTVNGIQLDYNEAFKNRLQGLDYYKNHDIRKNAVLGYEVLMTFSREATLDLDAWKKQSIDWLHKTFDVAPDNKTNIMHAEFHADEVGNVHIHAFVVPIDERGRLNAKRFTDGSRAMSELQTSYAKSVEDLGLKRGIAGSSAKHQDIRKMYANLNNALTLPKVKPKESAEAYRERVAEQVKTAFAAGMKAQDDYANQRRQELDEQAQQEREAIERELRKKNKIMEKELRKMQERKTQVEQQVYNYEDMVKELLEQISDVKMEMSAMQQQLQKEIDNENARAFYEDIQTGLTLLSEENPEEASIIEEDLEYLQYLSRMHQEQLEEQNNELETIIDENI